jgi:hypothetical protein
VKQRGFYPIKSAVNGTAIVLRIATSVIVEPSGQPTAEQMRLIEVTNVYIA